MWTGYSARPRPDFFLDLWETPVRVSDKVLSVTVFLGRDDSGDFVAYGTGFITVVKTDGYLFQQVVTASHVIEQINFDPICVRINRLDGRMEHAYLNLKDWVFHPDKSVDIAVCPANIPPEQYAIRHIDIEKALLTKEVLEEHDLGVGDEVYMSGMYTRHLGSTANTPIVRIGNLAAIPREKVETDRGYVRAYLIEARSIGGLSGSPVFLHPAPVKFNSSGQIKFATGNVEYFLGMMQGHHVTSNPTDIASPDDDYTPADMNTGIGVVIPADQIMDVIRLPKLEAQRKKLTKEAKEKAGFVPDAAAPVPSTKADNPSHEEDFNRLLTSVATGKRSDD